MRLLIFVKASYRSSCLGVSHGRGWGPVSCNLPCNQRPHTDPPISEQLGPAGHPRPRNTFCKRFVWRLLRLERSVLLTTGPIQPALGWSQAPRAILLLTCNQANIYRHLFKWLTNFPERKFSKNFPTQKLQFPFFAPKLTLFFHNLSENS